MKDYYIYIMSNYTNSTLYIGVTNNIIRRVEEHKLGVVDGFTKRYNIHKLVYFEVVNDVNVALEREKQLKHWSRQKKNWLIEQKNPNWTDLSVGFQRFLHALTLGRNDKVGKFGQNDRLERIILV